MKSMLKIPAFMAALAIFFLLSADVHARGAKGGQIEEIKVQEAAQLIKKKPGEVSIIDVRTPAEFAGGHLAGARNMDFFGGRFDVDVMNLPKNKPVLLYCRTGRRSAGAAVQMKEEGLKVLHMHEGIEGWQKAGLPLEKK